MYCSCSVPVTLPDKWTTLLACNMSKSLWLSMHEIRESLLDGKDLYSWPHCINFFQIRFFLNWKNSSFYWTSYLNEEASRFSDISWSDISANDISAKWQLYYFIIYWVPRYARALRGIPWEPMPLRGQGTFEWWVHFTVRRCHSREGRWDTGVGRSSSI